MALSEVVADLGERDRAFAHELSYGATRLRGRLDHLLSRFVHKGLDSLQPRVLEVLRLGAYQTLYMGSVPQYAAVSEAVDHAETVGGPGASGLVNAVLRRVGEAGDDAELFPEASVDPVGFLTTWGSHPRWLVERWLGRWPLEDVVRLVNLNNTRPSPYLAPLEGDHTQVLAALREAGLSGVPVGCGTECVRLDPGTRPAEALAAVPRAIVQDPGANLVAQYADVTVGTKVADLCAAPGGKALVVSGRASYTLAADRSEGRTRMLRDNIHRTGSRVGCVVADARHPPLRRADVVMLDVPCTGTGTLARHPDARWRLTEGSIEELARVQHGLLMGAAPCVPVGGLLVYSTCTLEPEENEAQIATFLNEHPEFRVEPTHAVEARFLEEGMLVVTPQAAAFDGAFAARLRRAA